MQLHNVMDWAIFIMPKMSTELCKNANNFLRTLLIYIIVTVIHLSIIECILSGLIARHSPHRSYHFSKSWYILDAGPLKKRCYIQGFVFRLV